MSANDVVKAMQELDSEQMAAVVKIQRQAETKEILDQMVRLGDICVTWCDSDGEPDNTAVDRFKVDRMLKRVCPHAAKEGKLTPTRNRKK
jgi:hypothetical protein